MSTSVFSGAARARLRGRGGPVWRAGSASVTSSGGRMNAAVERTIRVGGVRLHVREVGRGGPPVLLINGLGAHTAMWEHLEQALSGLHLIEFDAPGVGQSPAPPFPVTIPALAWLAKRVLEATGVNRADVLGYSMGGLVAQQLAISTPRLVRRLVLVATSCG